MLASLFAWHWEGHWHLTVVGLVIAIPQLIRLGKALLLERLRHFAELSDPDKGRIWLSDPCKTENQMRLGLVLGAFGEKAHSPTEMERYLIRLFNDLPPQVAGEDIHWGNIPGPVGRWEKNAQVRHYMRSGADVSSREAHMASRSYIRDHLYSAWDKMHQAVFHRTGLLAGLDDGGLGDCTVGVAHLARALHTIQDSYSPGHVRRQSGTGIIEEVHLWDDQNRREDKTRGWPGHAALDNRDHAMSRECYGMARRATSTFMLSVLANLDQDRSAFLRHCGNRWENHFKMK